MKIEIMNITNFKEDHQIYLISNFYLFIILKSISSPRFFRWQNINFIRILYVINRAENPLIVIIIIAIFHG
jgi:hypothetical protein